jgi:hypothetical protein
VTFENQTYRQNMTSTIGGGRVRVVFSNRFGTTPLRIGAAAIALRARESAIASESVRPLLFGGQREVTIPARADYVSDPVDFKLPPRTQFTVDIFVPETAGTPQSPLSFHLSAFTDSYVSGPGNHTGAIDFPVTRDTQSSYLIARVEVVAPTSTGAIVVLGASTTDGARSSRTNVRWPEILADRLNNRPGARMAVLNAGYGGNSLLRGGEADATIARLDRDVFALSGVTHLMVQQGISDIRATDAPTLGEMISGYRQIIQLAHSHGIKVIGVTLTPIGNTSGYNARSSAAWEAINHWIRTAGEYDGVVDFAKLLADPAAPTQYRAEWTVDYTHPSELGWIKMGNFIDLSLFAHQPKN